MASTNDEIVRTYFEGLGFLVLQPNKHTVSARRKRAREEIDFLIAKPEAEETKLPPCGLWSSSELARVQKAIVSVRGWHSERFTPSLLNSSEEIFRFTNEPVLAQARRQLGGGKIARILCLSALPAEYETRERSIAMLGEGGIEGIVQFPDMLLELSCRLTTKQNYGKSDVLQILRILKTYRLIRDPQLDLFEPR